MKNIIQILVVGYGLIFTQTVQEIKIAKDLIKKKGLSEEQIRSLAKQKGYSDEKIENALKKERKINQNTKKNNNHNAEKISQIYESEESSINNAKTENFNDDRIIDEKLSKIEKPPAKIEDTRGGVLDYFGYDIFKRDPALFQEASIGVVDPNYLIGPGDEIIIMLWGETQFRQVLSVDREGFIFIPEIGQVFVNGLNLKLLESKLFRVFSQSYASLDPKSGKATTFLDISLGNLRPLRIQVLGEIAQPGSYTVSPSTTLFSALYYFNGPTYNGSLRDIQLIRGGKKISSIDFYKYLLTGEKPLDQKLQLDDVIFVPPRLKSIAIEGEVKRSGIYELKSEEGFLSLINFAGGLEVTSYLDRSQIDRVVSFEDRERLGMDRMIIDVDLKEILKSKNQFSLQDGDIIKVFSISESRENTVSIEGAVNRPGTYDIGNSLKISQLIKRADGLMGDAYIQKIDLTRINPDYSEKLINLNLNKILNEDYNEDIFLNSNDKIKVYSITEMTDKAFVTINGHVKNKGSYLLQENMTLYDLIFKSGGFVDRDFKKLTYLKRAEIIRYKKENNNKEIIPFDLGLVLEKKGMSKTPLFSKDVIRIYSIAEIEGETRFVYLSGHAKRPGKYELYEHNMRIKDLLFKSGGYDDLVFKSNTLLSRADLIRIEEGKSSKVLIPFNLEDVLYNPESKQNYFLLPGDELRIYPKEILQKEQKVLIGGSVVLPGSYIYKKDMTLLDLILEARGLNQNSYLYRVEVSRLDILNQKKYNYADLIVFNITQDFKVKDHKSYNKLEDFLIKPYDKIQVRSNDFFTKNRIVQIEGEVQFPGDYSILKFDELITDIISRAGGLLPSSFITGSEYYRGSRKINVSFEKIIKNPKSKLNLRVQNGDIIKINKQPNLVIIEGEVNSPGIHKYVPNKRLNYYLDLAGGLNLNSEKNNIWIEYPNGDSKKYKRYSFISPKVIDGSVIKIGKKEETEPFDKTEYAKELTSILANIAQVIVILSLGN
jgi:polysaccharide biosynthesis/export protein